MLVNIPMEHLGNFDDTPIDVPNEIPYNPNEIPQNPNDIRVP